MGLLDTEQLTNIEQGFEHQDPALSHLMPTEAATEEEEAAMQEALRSISEYLYSQEGTAAVAQVLKQDPSPLYEKVAIIAKPLLSKAAGDIAEKGLGEHAGTIMFSEEGLIPVVHDMIMEMADEIGLNQARDPDEYSASLINLYKVAGEHVLESNDEAGIRDAKSVVEDMILTTEQGNMQSPDEFKESALKRDPMAAEVERALRGGA